MRNIDIIDFGDIKQSAVFANNRAEIAVTVPLGQWWLLDRAVIRATAGTPDLFVYVGTEGNENLVDGSSSGELDFADNNSPVVIQPGETLRFVWTGGTNGAVASVNAQYRVAAWGDITRAYKVAAPLEPETVIPYRRRKIVAGYGSGW